MRGVSCLCGCLEKPPPPPSGALPPSKLPPLQEALVKSDLCFLPQLLPGSLSSGKRGSPGGCGSSPEALPNPPTLMGAATVDAGGSRAHVAPRGPPGPWSQAGAWGHFPRGAPPKNTSLVLVPPCSAVPAGASLHTRSCVQARHATATPHIRPKGEEMTPSLRSLGLMGETSPPSSLMGETGNPHTEASSSRRPE